jgi:hypothetical protein
MTDSGRAQDDAGLHWFGAVVQFPECRPSPKVSIRLSVDSRKAQADLARVVAETRSA